MPAPEPTAIPINRPPPAPRRWLGYGVAVAAAALSFGLQLALAPIFQDRTIFVVFVPAAIAAAAVGGIGPALVVTALGLLGGFALHGAAITRDPANLIDAPAAR